MADVMNRAPEWATHLVRPKAGLVGAWDYWWVNEENYLWSTHGKEEVFAPHPHDRGTVTAMLRPDSQDYVSFEIPRNLENE